MAVVFGGNDTAGDMGSFGKVALYDAQLRMTSPMYPLAIGLSQTVAFDADSRRLNIVDSGSSRQWLMTDFSITSNRLRELTLQENRQEQIASLMEQANQAIDDKDWNHLIDLCSRVLELDSNNVECYVRRGNAHFSLQHLDAALSDYDRALQIDPFNLFAPLQRTKVHILAKHFIEAEEDATHTIERVHLINRPPLPTGGFEFSRKIYDYALKISRNGQAEPWLLRSRIRLELGNFESARSDLEQAVQLGGENDETRALRAQLENAPTKTNIVNLK
jgi:tetratricopeptide (TPR) repeat protein